MRKEKKLIIVDIQPVYRKYIEFLDLKSLVKTMKKYDKILFLYVGKEQGLTEDDKFSIIDFLVEYGAKDKLIDKINFVDKGYGNLRGWMDQGVTEETIINSLKYMIEKGVTDSRNIHKEELEKLITENDCISKHDPIFYPSFDLDILREYNNADICGGGRNECLREVELCLEALDIETNRLEEFIY